MICCFTNSVVPTSNDVDEGTKGIPFLSKVLEYAEEYVIDYRKIQIEEGFVAKIDIKNMACCDNEQK